MVTRGKRVAGAWVRTRLGFGAAAAPAGRLTAIAARCLLLGACTRGSVSAYPSQQYARPSPGALHSLPGQSRRARGLKTHLARLVGAVHALAVVGARDAGLEALAVLLQALGLLAVAALAVFLRAAGRILPHARAVSLLPSVWIRNGASGSFTFCGLWAILGRKALGFRSSVASIAAFRSAAFSRLLQQFWQLQLKQYSPDAKHSQYLPSTV